MHVKLTLTGHPVYNHSDIGVVVCGGVEMRGLKASLAPRRQQQQAAPKLEKYMFLPYQNDKVRKLLR
jgi:fatty acid synthase